jgi:hypothetical protein
MRAARGVFPAARSMTASAEAGPGVRLPRRPGRCRPTGLPALTCMTVWAGGGSHIVRADVRGPFVAYAASQTDATGWFTFGEMQSLRLHPGFRQWVEDRMPDDQ